ncbi:MAG: hypothetical protein K6A72_10605 [Lachnospiraceae bacterium]|nr:hypothetical protein [Lachnospiraceae bacterium]
MAEILNGIFTAYSQYSGSGVIMIIFFVGLVYIAVTEKNTGTRTILVDVSAILLLGIFLPPVYYVYTKFISKDTYWQLFWMLPIGIGLGYVASRIIREHTVSGVVLVLVVLFFGGEFISKSIEEDDLTNLSNVYRMPTEVVEVVDRLHDISDDEVVHAAFTEEFLPYVRQYDADIVMPYGYSVVDSDRPAEFYLLMSSDVADFAKLEQKCIHTGTEYLVLPSDRKPKRPFGHYAFRRVTEVSGYSIYQYAPTDGKVVGTDGMDGKNRPIMVK